MERLRALQEYVVLTRKAKGLSQAHVAKIGRISRNTLAAFERAPIPYLPAQATLQGIAKGIGVPYETLDRMARGKSGASTEDEQAEAIMERIASLGPDQRATLERVIDGLLLLQGQPAN